MGSRLLARGYARHGQYRAALVDPHEVSGTNNALLLNNQDLLLRGVGGQLAYDWTQMGVPLGRYSLPKRLDRAAYQGQEDLSPASPNWTLFGKDLFFGDFGQPPDYDWQLPIPRPAYRGNRQLEVDLVNGPLLGQDRVWADPGQVPVYDWPVPKGRPFPLENRTGELVLVTGTLLGQDLVYAAPGQAPTVDLSRGRSAARLLQHEQPPNLQVLQPVAPTTLPDGTSFWLPLPTPADRRAVQPEPPPNLQGTTLLVAVGAPLLPLDWPNPLPKPAHRENRTLIDFVSTLLGQDQVYGAPGQAPDYEWVVPTGYRQPVQPEIPPSLQGTALFVPPPVPLLPLDWPNPLRREPTRDTRTHLDAGEPLPLLGQDAVYGAPGQAATYDWTGLGVPLAAVVLPRRQNQAARRDLDVDPASVLATLVGQDRVYAGPGQVPVYVWTVPAGHPMRRRLYLLAVAGDPGLMALIAQPPDTPWRVLRVGARPSLVAPTHSGLVVPARDQSLEVP